FWWFTFNVMEPVHLHSTSSAPVSHTNLKAVNVLLDHEFMPHLCDSGVAVLRSCIGNATELEAST
ncbi:hypothetical protein MKX03_016844, partial [Papaver bracteatum]